MIDRDEFWRLCQMLPELSWQQTQRDKKFWDDRLRSSLTPEQWHKFGEGPMSEQVLVFPASALESFADRFLDRVITDPHQIKVISNRLLASGVTHYMDRAAAEDDPNFKQLIPYCLLAFGRDEYFAYQRTKKSGESRLHDKWSVGVGGHINPCDGDASDGGYEAAFRRELSEEVSLELPPGEQPIVGIVYDPSNDVGKVHFGIVHKIRVASKELAFKDPALANGQWLSRAALKAANKDGHFENWSSLVVEYML